MPVISARVATGILRSSSEKKPCRGSLPSQDRPLGRDAGGRDVLGGNVRCRGGRAGWPRPARPPAAHEEGRTCVTTVRARGPRRAAAAQSAAAVHSTTAVQSAAAPSRDGPGPDHPLRIALLSYRSKPHCGGQGVYVRHLSRELAALGHRVEVFSGQPYPELEPGPVLREIPSLDLYRDEDPFRTPHL